MDAIPAVQGLLELGPMCSQVRHWNLAAVSTSLKALSMSKGKEAQKAQGEQANKPD
jgi:hypothetical protein